MENRICRDNSEENKGDLTDRVDDWTSWLSYAFKSRLHAESVNAFSFNQQQTLMEKEILGIFIKLYVY